ncbi:MAG: PKD domain-containing protein, partial [Thermoplasmata archaeon]
MMKGWNVLLVVSALIIIGWSPAVGAGNAGYIPDHVMVNVETHQDMIRIDIRIPNFNFRSIHLPEGDFTEIELPGEGYTTDIGKAKLPAIRRMVEIPYGAEPVIKSVIADWYYVSLAESPLSEMIQPYQPSPRKDMDDTPEFVINTTFYSTNSFVPSDVVRIVQTGEIRGHRYVMIEIVPVQYNPALGKLRLMRSCTIEIELPGADIEKTVKIEKRYSSPSFEPILENLLLNYNAYMGDDEGSKDSTDVEGYLIIVYDDFYDEIAPFANWKEGLGFDVTVTKTSEIPGGPTKENIKSYIENAYYNWPVPPSYVLLVGDTPQIPTWTGDACGSAADQYYVDVDDDPFADMHIGRFPAATDSQVTVMVEKTECYVNGDFPDDNYIKRAAFMASEDNYQISEGTHNYVISNYLEPNGFSCDKLYCHTYGATTQDVKDALNDGRGLAIYSGHGSETAWVDGPYFDQGDVNSLTNNQIHPFVCSHACLTGKFTVSECFGETWLRAPDKGGFAFWGSSTYTYWDEDDVLEKKMFKAWWEDNIETIGGMTDMAKYYLYQYYGGAGRSQYYLECYNLLGDPSIKLWRSNPLKADFYWSPEYPHPNELIYFFDASTNAQAWTWDFGDGTTSYERNPIHTYASEGIYSVTLTVYGSGGRTDTCTKQVAVYENWPPIAIAHPEQYVGNNPTVHFDGSDSWD